MREERPATITPEHLEEAQRLRELWEKHQLELIDKKEPRLTQGQFGLDYELGSQGAVWQFLQGRTPLSLKAARGFARGLGCRIEDFSPRLAKQVSDLAPYVDDQGLDLARLTRNEFQLIQLYRGLDIGGQRALDGLANRLYSEKRSDGSGRVSPDQSAPGSLNPTKTTGTKAA